MQIHQVKTRYSNSYVIEEGASVLVIDVALRCDGFVIRYITEELGRSPEDVDLVVCTHDDPDHIGGVAAMARSCAAVAAIPHAAKRPYLKFLNNPFGPMVKIATSMREALRPRSRQMYMNADRDKRYQFVHNHILQDGDTKTQKLHGQRLRDGRLLKGFENWKVLHTPGHSWDSVCFFHEPSKALVTGDTLLGSGTLGRLVQPSIYADPIAMRRTMEKLKSLKPITVYPGHGSVFSGEHILDHF